MAAEVDPAFANVYFNLALVQAINNELAPEDEGRNADELLRNLKQSLAATKSSRLGAP